VLEALDELEQRSRPLLLRRKRWLVGASAFSLTLAGLGMMHGKSRQQQQQQQQHRRGAAAAAVSTVAAAPRATAATDSSSLPVASDPAPSPPPRNQNRIQPPAQKVPTSPTPPVAASARQVSPGKTRAEPIWENPFAPGAAPEPSREVVLNAERRPDDGSR
jgi:hypothetical protein